jgi:hypothetical protein
MRAIDMNVIRPTRKRQEEEKAAEKVADLMSEEEFQSLYAQALTGGAAEEAEQVLDLVETVVEEEPAPVVQGYEPEVVPPVPEEPVVQGTPIVVPPPVPEVVLPRARPRVAVPVAPEPPSTPLTFAEAQAELSRSSDREQVATTVLRFAVGKWRRSLLLSVQGNLVTGWRGMGKGVREAAVKRIGIGLAGPSTFRLVRDTRSHYVGPVKRDAASGLFYKLLGGDYPTTAVILPLLVRGKLVHLLYVDNGPGQLTPPDVGELLILSQSVGRSYEAMIRQRKSA